MVKSYFPQSAARNLDANSTHLPQGLDGGGIPPEFLFMLYEDGTKMLYEDSSIMDYETTP